MIGHPWMPRGRGRAGLHSAGHNDDL